MNFRIVFICFLFPFSATGQDNRLTTGSIFGQPFITGTRPSSPALSPDGKWVTFQWNENGNDTLFLYLVNTQTQVVRKVSPVASSRFLNWRKDSGSFLFLSEGDLYSADIRTGKTDSVTSTGGAIRDVAESSQLNRLVTLSSTHLQIIRQGLPLIQSVPLETDPVDTRIAASTPDAAVLILRESKTDSAVINPVPDWMGSLVTTRPSERSGWYQSRYRLLRNLTKTEAIISDSWIPGYGGPASLSADGRFFAFSSLSIDQKTRHFILVDLSRNQADTVFTESDTAWVNPLDGFGFSPDSRFLAFSHESSGWNHLYLWDTGNKTLKQVTSGSFEIDFFRWNPAKPAEILYTSTEDSPFHRPIRRVNCLTGKREKLTSEPGVRTEISVSEDGSRLVYLKSTGTDPGDLFLLDPASGKETRLTRSVPEKFAALPLKKPEIRWIKNPQTQTQFPVQIYFPDQFKQGVRYPVVLFIHGAGYLQNVMDHFGYYWREHLFNYYLAQKGYLVVNVDYSGSAGYGRDNRISVYRDMGGPDWKDCAETIRYLAAEGLADSSRAGIYGGSYGGFLTLMALFKSPELFKAGAALRAVANWKLYNRWYTEQRLGPLKLNQEVYEKTSPVTWCSGYRGHLLLLHGMADDNVLFQDIVQLSQKLIENNQKFDLMIYPTEGHGFRSPTAWRHEYEEIEAHFDRYLKN